MSPASSAAINPVRRSSAGAFRFQAIAASMCSSIRSLASAAARISSSLMIGSSVFTIVCDRSRSMSASAGGIPSMREMTVKGSGKAMSAITSIAWSRATTRSSCSSTSSCTSGRSCSITRGVKAFCTRRRRRVWSGGSLPSIDGLRSPIGRPITSSMCSRWASKSVATLVRGSRSTRFTSSNPSMSHAPIGSWCTRAASRIWL